MAQNALLPRRKPLFLQPMRGPQVGFPGSGQLGTRNRADYPGPGPFKAKPRNAAKPGNSHGYDRAGCRLRPIKFAQGFYEAVWAGQSFEKAFKFGCSAIDTANIPEEHIPIILKSHRLGGARLGYTEETQRIENFVLKFLNSSRQERAALTTQGAAILQKMGESQEEAPRRVISSVTVTSIRTVCKIYKEAQVVIRSGLQANNQAVYLKPAGDSFLLDWEATVGYWSIPVKTFKALGTNSPICVRVAAELSDYFNYGYEDRIYVSLELKHISGERIHGYIHRGHADFHRLVSVLYDGSGHRITLEIFPGKDETSCVDITRFVSDSWVVPEDGSAGGREK